MATKLRLGIGFSVDIKEFSTQMQKMSRELVKTGKQFQEVGQKMSTYLTLPLALVGGASLKLASDVQESMNKVDVAFDKSAQVVKDFAKTTLETFGIAEGTALDMSATYGDMATSMGLTNMEAAKMSTSLVGLAGDLASFKNISIDIANTALTSIFTGETESLKRLGIVMTQHNLNQFAMQKGLGKTVQQMTQAEATMLRYEYILANTKNSQGDFARTQENAANQGRKFMEGLKELGADLGKLILPAFTKLISLGNSLIEFFRGLTDGQKKFVIAIGAAVAVMGPLLLAFGALMQFIPVIMTGFVGLAGPIGIVILAIAGLTTAFMAFTDSNKKVKTASEETKQKIDSEVGSFKTLFEELKHTNYEHKRRQELIDQINSTYGTTLTNIKDETKFANQLAKAYNNVTSQIRERIILEANQTRLTEMVKEQIELQAKLEKAQIAANKRAAKGMDFVSDENSGYGLWTLNNQLEAKIAAQQKIVEDGMAGLAKLAKPQTNTISGGKGGVSQKIDLDPISNFDEQEFNDKMAAYDELGAKYQSLGSLMAGVNTEIIDSTVVMEDTFESFGDRVAATMERLNQIFTNMVNDMVVSFGEFIGDMVNGDMPLENFGVNILQSLAAFAGEFGKTLIAFGIGALGLKELFKNPFTAIAAGIGLVALSKVASNAAAKTSRALQNVGNSSSTSDLGGGSYGSSNFANRNDNQMVLETVVYGNDLYLSNQRTNNRMYRVK